MRDGEVIDGLTLGRLDEREHTYIGGVGAPVEEADAVAALLGEEETLAAREPAGRPCAFREAVGDLDLSEAADEVSPFADLVEEAKAVRRPNGRGDFADLLGGPLTSEED